jgi:DNA-binding MarR family transcriptional regulator
MNLYLLMKLGKGVLSKNIQELYFKAILEKAKEKKEFTISQIASELGISWNTAEKYIKKFEEMGLVKRKATIQWRRSPKKIIVYEIVKAGENQ